MKNSLLDTSEPTYKTELLSGLVDACKTLGTELEVQLRPLTDFELEILTQVPLDLQSSTIQQMSEAAQLYINASIAQYAAKRELTGTEYALEHLRTTHQQQKVTEL